jgi:hypothetical protein
VTKQHKRKERKFVSLTQKSIEEIEGMNVLETDIFINDLLVFKVGTDISPFNLDWFKRDYEFEYFEGSNLTCAIPPLKFVVSETNEKFTNFVRKFEVENKNMAVENMYSTIANIRTMTSNHALLHQDLKDSYERECLSINYDYESVLKVLKLFVLCQKHLANVLCTQAAYLTLSDIIRRIKESEDPSSALLLEYWNNLSIVENNDTVFGATEEIEDRYIKRAAEYMFEEEIVI